MSLQLQSTIPPLLLGLVVGFAGAAWLGSHRDSLPAPPSASARLDAPQLPPTPALSAAFVEAPSPADEFAETAQLAGRAQPVWRALAHVTVPGGREQKWLRLPTLELKEAPADAPALNPEFAEFFGLTAAEQARIETGLDAVIAARADLDLQAARAIALPGEGFLAGYEAAFTIEPYPEAGAALHDQLDGLLREVLGAERIAVYDRWSQTSLLADWRGVGLTQRTIHLARVPESGYHFWNINYEAATPDGERQQFNSMGTTLERAEALSGFPLARWLAAHPLPDPPARPGE